MGYAFLAGSKYDSCGTKLAEWPVEARANETVAAAGVNSAGEVYVTINGNHRVVKYDSSGTKLAEWPVEIQIGENINGMAVDPNTGEVFVTINGNH